MLRVKGRYETGYGGASDTLKAQLPMISKGFPEVKNCHSGTINVTLEARVVVAGWDHRTEPIKCWGDDTEVFDFVRARIFFPILNRQYPAWMYVPHGSPHRLNPYSYEFITEHVQGLQQGADVEIECDRPYIELPYTEWTMIDGMLRLARTYVIQ